LYGRGIDGLVVFLHRRHPEVGGGPVQVQRIPGAVRTELAGGHRGAVDPRHAVRIPAAEESHRYPSDRSWTGSNRSRDNSAVPSFLTTGHAAFGEWPSVCSQRWSATWSVRLNEASSRSRRSTSASRSAIVSRTAEHRQLSGSRSCRISRRLNPICW